MKRKIEKFVKKLLADDAIKNTPLLLTTLHEQIHSVMTEDSIQGMPNLVMFIEEREGVKCLGIASSKFTMSLMQVMKDDLMLSLILEL